jgi:hypothetical protein
MQNNIIRHHRLGGQAAPRNVVQIDKRALGPKELARAVKDDFTTVMQRPMNVASTILNFSRKHGGSLANKLKLKDMGKAALPLLYDPTKHPKLYANLAADVATDTALRGGRAIDEATRRISDVKSKFSLIDEKAGDVKEKVEDKIRGGLYDGNDKINQATATAADKAGTVIDRTKEGASRLGRSIVEGASRVGERLTDPEKLGQVGQEIASTGMAGVDPQIRPADTGAVPKLQDWTDRNVRGTQGQKKVTPQTPPQRPLAGYQKN